MGDLLVMGGRQRTSINARQEWQFYDRALALRLSADGQFRDVAIDYVTPPDLCADHLPSIVFKASSLVGDRLYACTQTEVLVYRLPDMRLETHLSLPCFNDVHHVTPTPQTCCSR